MADTLRFALVDVFADEPLTGNPAALVADADDLGDGQLRALAREFNQSETAFLLQPSQSDATLRIRAFTAAGSEVGGAGHFALAAWLWLDAADALPRDGSPLVQELGGDRLPVEVTRTPGQSTLVTIDQSPAEFGDLVEDTTMLVRALGLAAGDLTGEPVQVVSTASATCSCRQSIGPPWTGPGLTPRRSRPCCEPRAARVATSTAGTLTIPPPAPWRTPGSSTRRSGSGRTPRPVPPPAR